VARREEHPVSVVVRESDGSLVEHAHESRLAALVGALRSALGIRRGQEDHVASLDERPVAVVDRRPAREEPLLDPVGEPLRVEAILVAPAAFVVHTHGAIMRTAFLLVVVAAAVLATSAGAARERVACSAGPFTSGGVSGVVFCGPAKAIV